jgi:hypothetical protein
VSNQSNPNHPETQSLALIERPEAPLALNRPPDVVLEEATRAAKALTDVIEKKKKKVVFNGETYLEFEDWQTLGRFYGVTARVRQTKEVTYGADTDYETHGFEATADAILVATNQVISSADAMCMNDEYNWRAKPMFQLRSMAQTRACAKCLRNVLAWIVVLAGYKPTPSEEMDGIINQQPANPTGIKRTERKPIPPASAKPSAPRSYPGPNGEEDPFARDRRA